MELLTLPEEQELIKWLESNRDKLNEADVFDQVHVLALKALPEVMLLSSDDIGPSLDRTLDRLWGTFDAFVRDAWEAKWAEKDSQ